MSRIKDYPTLQGQKTRPSVCFLRPLQPRSNLGLVRMGLRDALEEITIRDVPKEEQGRWQDVRPLKNYSCGRTLIFSLARRRPATDA